MEELVLEVDSLRKVFRGPRGGAVTAVDGVTFTVRRGEVVGLLGPNGAGKTTTIKCVLGLMTPDVGSIRILGMTSGRATHGCSGTSARCWKAVATSTGA